MVELWTKLERSLGAVSRLKSMEENAPAEDREWKVVSPAGGWPLSGEIELQNVTASYTWVFVVQCNYYL